MSRPGRLRRALRAAPALVAGVALFVSAPARAHDDLVPTIERLREHAESATELTTPARRAARLLERGELERLAGARDRAESDYVEAERLDPANVALPLCRAALAADCNLWARAESLAGTSLLRTPGDPRAYRLRARAERALGRPREALADLDRALACPNGMRPDDALERARWALTLDGPASALAGLERALERAPDSTPLALRAIELESGLGRTNGALARLDRLLARCERCAELRARRGDLLAAASRTLEAEAEWSAALASLEPLDTGARPADQALAARLRRALGAQP